jgi:hypothetical protein
MRKAAILILLVGLVGWSGRASATRVPPPTRCEGDPDEFQAKQVFDEGGLRPGAAGRSGRVWRKVGDKAQGLARTSARSTGAAGGPTVSITLAGRSYLWER